MVYQMLIMIDGHNDLPFLVRAIYDNHIYDPGFAEKFTNGGLFGHVDLPRLRKGKVGGTFWSVYPPCPANWSDFSDETYAASMFGTASPGLGVMLTYQASVKPTSKWT